jgi:flagellar FliL protein
MAKEDKKEESAPAEGGEKKGGMMKMIIIINVVVVVLLLGVVAAMFLLKGGDEKKEDTEVLAGQPAEGEHAAPSGSKTPIYIPLSPPFVVNFENQDQEVAFLQVEIELMTYDPALMESVKNQNPMIRNELLLLLGGQQYHDINTPEGKRKLAQQALEIIRKILQDGGGSSAVEAVLFTSFVMQ